jgi:sec-independent protein translocase protein TatA
MLGWPQGGEWVIILIIALLIFGKRLPDVARSIGRSLTEFKKGINEAKETKDDVTNDIKHVKNDVVKQAKDASGLNDSNNN